MVTWQSKVLLHLKCYFQWLHLVFKIERFLQSRAKVSQLSGTLKMSGNFIRNRSSLPSVLVHFLGRGGEYGGETKKALT